MICFWTGKRDSNEVSNHPDATLDAVKRAIRPKQTRGFAIVYALLVSVCFLTFFAALTYQMRDTVSALRQSEDLMKARALATLGNDLFYQLLREENVDWRATPFRFSNEPGPDYFRGLPDHSPLRETLSAEALGGYFTVQLEDGREVDGLVLPADGTYLVSTCQARVNRRETFNNESSRFVLKMSSPFVNYLSAVSGELNLRGNTLFNGPIYAREREDGSGGDIEMLAHRTRYDPFGGVIQIRETCTVGGVFQARGEIHVLNNAAGTDDIQRVLTRGSMNDGDQLLVAPSFSPVDGSGLGGLEVVGGLLYESGVSTLVEISKREDIFSDLASLTAASPSESHEIDLDSLSLQVARSGVLVEFERDRAVVSEIEFPFYGRYYDLASLEAALRTDDRTWTRYANRMEGPGGIERGLRECRWDDPAFDNAPVPNNLRDALVDLGANPADIPSVSDYFDIFKIERGVVLKTIGISDDRFTHIRFSSSLASCPTEGSGSGATTEYSPPVYLRGQIDGKVVVSYEGRGELLDQESWPNPDIAPNRLVVLSDSAGPGYAPVSGGITLADDRTMDSHDATGSFSNDYCLLVTNGDVLGIGMPKYYHRWICGTPGGGRFREGHDSWKDSVDIETHRDVFATEVPPGHEMRQYITNARSQIPSQFHGVSISAGGRFHRQGFGPTGQPIPGDQDFALPVPHDSNPPISWTGIVAEGYSVSDPVLAGTNDVAYIPDVMRDATASKESVMLTRGAHAFFEREPQVVYPQGAHNYDYRWRTLDADTLEKDVQLKVTPILIERRGY